jgi:hypothetical protein
MSLPTLAGLSRCSVELLCGKRPKKEGAGNQPLVECPRSCYFWSAQMLPASGVYRHLVITH